MREFCEDTTGQNDLQKCQEEVQCVWLEKSSKHHEGSAFHVNWAFQATGTDEIEKKDTKSTKKIPTLIKDF